MRRRSRSSCPRTVGGVRSRDDRHLRLGEKLADLDEAATASKFAQARVVIAWDHTVARHAPEMITLAANLIARFCPRIHLSTADPMTELTLELLHELDTTSLAEFTRGEGIPPDVTASLYLGGGTPPALPHLTTASAVGWIVHLSSEGDSLDPLEPFVPFGYLAAAALGACEVFKRLLPPAAGRGRLFGRTVYSTFNYASTDPLQGPGLPNAVEVNVPALLAGAGAVGQAFLHAISVLPQVEGELLVVDKEVVDEGNLNRYVLASENDAVESVEKTALAVRAFDGRTLRIVPEPRDLQAVVDDINEGKLNHPTVVVSALDRYEPRRLVQNLWPDLVFEGATGDTLLQVFRHAFQEGLACLRCIHTEPAGRPYEETLAEATGLSPQRIAQAFSGERPLLEEADIECVRPELQQQVRRDVGKDICGVLQELARFETAPGHDQIQPAVSFTSYLSGLFVAAEFVRFFSGIPPGLPGRYQLDPVSTLDPAKPWAEKKHGVCYCVDRAKVIEVYRARARRAPPR